MKTKCLDCLCHYHCMLHIVILFFTLSNPSLPGIAVFYILDGLGGGLQVAAAAGGVSLLGVIITKPLGIHLTRKMGAIKLMKICLIGIIAMNALCAFCQSYYLLLFLWFVHGLFTGPMYLLVVTTIRQFGEKKKVGFYTQCFLSILVVGPIVGGSIGALFAYFLSWRLAFLFFASVHTLMLLWLFIIHAKEEVRLRPLPIDWIGFTLYALGFLCLGFCLNLWTRYGRL